MLVEVIKQDSLEVNDELMVYRAVEVSTHCVKFCT